MGECFFIRQLNAFSAAYKAQFDTPPDIPLHWMLSDYGDLWLDSFKLCRGAFVGPDKPSFTANRLHIPTRDGYMEIIIKRPTKNPARISEIIYHKIIPF